MPSVMVIGASRGIGLELARQYGEAGWQVHATTRSLALPGKLGALAGDVNLYSLDVCSDDDIANLAVALNDTPIDVLIYNAGVIGSRGEGDETTRKETFRINAEAPILVATALLDNVAASDQKKIAVMSSTQGSGRLGGKGGYLYGDSKGLLNAKYRECEPQWRERGIASVALHPGYVRTDMTGMMASLSPKKSVKGIRQVLAALSLADSGRFVDYKGKIVAW
ncbi:MAG: SDR family NAD(P)-dependent oxidoreductase [Alphaproteobacteria bacterium]|nr:SDR family NAD(P)-dependent oxidoreductase [Alphaproteobacteria bacterium]